MDFTNLELRFSRASEQLSCELAGEIAILNLDARLYFGLKEVSALVWREIESPKTLAQLTSAVMAEYEVDEARCREDIAKLLNDLWERGLLDAEAAS